MAIFDFLKKKTVPKKNRFKTVFFHTVSSYGKNKKLIPAPEYA